MASYQACAKSVLSQPGRDSYAGESCSRHLADSGRLGRSAIGLAEGLSDMASRPFIVIRLMPESPVDRTTFDTLDSTIYYNVKVKNAELPVATQYQAISASGTSLHLTLPPPPDESAWADRAINQTLRIQRRKRCLRKSPFLGATGLSQRARPWWAQCPMMK